MSALIHQTHTCTHTHIYI